MENFLRKLLGDKAGASSVEYALILAVFSSAIVVGVGFIGASFETSMYHSKLAIEKEYN